MRPSLFRISNKIFAPNHRVMNFSRILPAVEQRCEPAVVFGLKRLWKSTQAQVTPQSEYKPLPCFFALDLEIPISASVSQKN